jgi:hypothetical protein
MGHRYCEMEDLPAVVDDLAQLEFAAVLESGSAWTLTNFVVFALGCVGLPNAETA